MSGDLPEGWEEAEIGLLCNLINGRAFKPSDWTTDGLPIVRIQNLNNQNASYNHYKGEVKDKFLINNGQLLFAWSGTPGTSFGAHIWKGGEAVLNQHIFKVLFGKQSLDIDFLRYAINQKLEELITKAHGGVGLRHVTKGKFEQTLISLPPLNEQKRIADKLDTVLAAVGRVKGRLDKAETLLKRFRQSVLNAATTGKLTEEWRAAQGIEDEWGVKTLEDLSFSITDGDHQAPPQVDHGISFLVISNIRNGYIDFKGVSRWVPESYYEGLKETRKAEPNDILYTVTGSIGIPVIVKDEIPFCFQRHIAIIKCDHEKVGYRYLALALASNLVMQQALAVATGTAQKTIPLKGLRKFNIPFPTKMEQQEIVRRVESLFAAADRIEERLGQTRKRVERLESALLAKAFKGELVAQDPNDEPASELLKRIKAERAEKVTNEKPRRRKRAG